MRLYNVDMNTKNFQRIQQMKGTRGDYVSGSCVSVCLELGEESLPGPPPQVPPPTHLQAILQSRPTPSAVQRPGAFFHKLSVYPLWYCFCLALSRLYFVSHFWTLF